MTCWSEPLILRLRGPDSPRRMTDARAYGEGHGKRMPDPRGDGSPGSPTHHDGSYAVSTRGVVAATHRERLKPQ
jgi:hypothetical protein